MTLPPALRALDPASLAALGGGALVALLLLAMPAALLEAIVAATGVAAIFPAAAPPLGITARLALAVTLGAGLGAFGWFGAMLLPEVRAAFPMRVRRRRPIVDLPTLRKADAHPDAPVRAPVMAMRDLGAPFLEVRARPATPPAERPLPRDLEAPLAAFDPSAIPDAPADPVPLLDPLAPPMSDVRIEAYELPTPIAAPRTEATIHALLDRLERGVSRREVPKTGLDQTLSELRKLAATR